MKLLSWNVNGIRSAVQKGFLDFFEKEQADVVCLQETKISADKLEPVFAQIPGYDIYWSFAEKKGYSGVAVYTRRKPLSVTEGMGVKEVDSEGRVLTLEYPNFYLVNVYAPNAQSELARLDFRLDYERRFLEYLQKLRKKKPIALTGDLNVAHTPLDLTNPKSNEKNPGYSPQEREAFTNLLAAGYVDTFRMFTQEGGHYSWWSFRSNARAKNVGWRIDYWVVSEEMRDKVKRSVIRPEIFGSDHCPVELELSGL